VYSPIDAGAGTEGQGDDITVGANNSPKTRSTSIDSNDSEESASRRNIIATLGAVFHRNPAVLVFAAVVFLSGFGAGAIDSYLFLHLKELGGSGLLMGIARFITCAAEVPMFQVAGSLQKTYGTWPMIALTQMAFVVRFVYYSLLSDPWLVLPCEALNGLTFAVTWSVSCTYANEISPPGCQGVMQALLEGLHFGIGCGVGSLVGGFVYQYYGSIRLFQCCGMLSLASTVLALFAWRLCDAPPGRDGEQSNSTTVHKGIAVAAVISTSSPRTKPKAQGATGGGKYLELQQMEEDVAV
jgi:predicted MFS family arabinose efflux permease